mmetsp:Transcript_46645/g.76490  ORF Transcript_46645/g.76490 Transcript_46645/m.76490 type:complete len:225 (-) Transcript_46645:436-1110(-)
MATLCPLDQIPIMLIAPQINTAMQHTYESLPPLAGKGCFFRRKIFGKLSTLLRNLDETHGTCKNIYFQVIVIDLSGCPSHHRRHSREEREQIAQYRERDIKGWHQHARHGTRSEQRRTETSVQPGNSSLAEERGHAVVWRFVLSLPRKVSLHNGLDRVSRIDDKPPKCPCSHTRDHAGPRGWPHRRVCCILWSDFAQQPDVRDHVYATGRLHPNLDRETDEESA